jgi:hypothetical protein
MNDVTGTWLLRGTGTTLVVVPTSSIEGEYVLDDDGDGWSAPDERGSVTLRPDGSVVLSPTEGDDRPCATVFRRVLTTGATLEGEAAENSCGWIGRQQGTWIRIN